MNNHLIGIISPKNPPKSSPTIPPIWRVVTKKLKLSPWLWIVEISFISNETLGYNMDIPIPVIIAIANKSKKFVEKTKKL